ncbi:hypothetical protein FS749_005689 [Ceratobasidium sp. UAMH 11750]|nr:hypothetical protein FS749_005689 [Ceratobasidium sp. UAMH 11750]
MNRGRFLGICTWIVLCVLTLGFSPKYRNWLRKFESLVTNSRVTEQVQKRIVKSAGRSSGRLSSRTTGKARKARVIVKVPNSGAKQAEAQSMRAEQQTEWDRLSTAMSVITATSAAALAIPGLAVPGTYWVISSCFCVALGLSLEGLMLVTYISLVSGVATDEIIGLLATGDADVYALTFRSIISPQVFASIVLALPAAFISYSSLFLLIGTFFMVIHQPTGSSVDTRERPFSILSLVPLSFGALVMIFVVLICEVVLRRHTRDMERNVIPDDQERTSVST